MKTEERRDISLNNGQEDTAKGVTEASSRARITIVVNSDGECGRTSWTLIWFRGRCGCRWNLAMARREASDGNRDFKKDNEAD